MDYEAGMIVGVLVSGKKAQLFGAGNAIREETGDFAFRRREIMVVTSSTAACEVWKIRGWAAQLSHLWAVILNLDLYQGWSQQRGL